jgi:ABC-type microcin C transport system duplicated ATPase subunit YejF
VHGALVTLAGMVEKACCCQQNEKRLKCWLQLKTVSILIDTSLILLILVREYPCEYSGCQRITIGRALATRLDFIEQAFTRDLFKRPQQSFTRQLLQAIPREITPDVS